tara:strand:- start:213 stop:446 length:234 start_codon:yes stop_codon:yes gene_type:complete
MINAQHQGEKKMNKMNITGYEHDVLSEIVFKDMSENYLHLINNAELLLNHLDRKFIYTAGQLEVLLEDIKNYKKESK